MQVLFRGHAELDKLQARAACTLARLTSNNSDKETNTDIGEEVELSKEEAAVLNRLAEEVVEAGQAATRATIESRKRSCERVLGWGCTLANGKEEIYMRMKKEAELMNQLKRLSDMAANLVQAARRGHLWSIRDC